MRKLFLLLASGSIAFTTTAQLKPKSVVNATPSEIDAARYKSMMRDRLKSDKGLAHKTTADPRWYSYVDFFDQNESAMSSSIDFAAPYLWHSPDALMAYGDGSGGTTFDTVNFISYGMMTDPAFGTSYNGFNDYNYYLGETKITSADAFTIDSLLFTGLYVTNPAKVGASGYVDTLRVKVVYGNGAATSNIREGSLTVASGDLFTNYGAAVGSTFKYQYMLFDTANNYVNGSPSFTKDILLDNTVTPASWSADTVNGIYIGAIEIPGGFNVPAGNMVGISVSFITGDPGYAAGDTVFFGSPTVPPVKYNMFRPIIAYKGSGATVNWLTYNVNDRNTGGYASGDEAAYSPHWFWSAGSSAATAQYPDISFHVSACASCGVVTEPPTSVSSVEKVKVNAYPNPAVGELNVPFSMQNNANVTVTLTNVMGQVVATQNMGNVANGVAKFNTTALPSGLYTYAVIADGVRTTGRVAVAH